MSTNHLFISWQNSISRAWYVIGKLSQQQDGYIFQYVQGARKAQQDGFLYLDSMSDLYAIYRSEQLFPFLKNRLLSPRRPEYPQFISWLGFTGNPSDIEVLARSSGTKVTDNLQTFSPISFNQHNEFCCYFFVHGTQHGNQHEQHIFHLKCGDKLTLKCEPDNPFDKNAVLVCENNPNIRLGYCPRYLAEEISTMLDDNLDYYRLSVERIEPNAPKNYRLMCRFEGRVKSDIDTKMIASKDYEPITAFK